MREFFDHQAAKFERRAGLPEIYCREIATAVLKVAGARTRDLLLELGPGTGQIGRFFASAVRYLGIDLSKEMLREFRARAGEETKGLLVRADAQGTWPVADASVRVVFSSRAAHLLDEEHVAREFFRVAEDRTAMLIIGRVRREQSSMRATLAREMNSRLQERGFEGRGGERRNRRLFDACRERGAEPLDACEVARWTVRASPQGSLDSWRSLVSLGGVAVPAPVHEEILRELEAWATREFGSLNREFEEEESYTLHTLRCG